MGTVVVGHGYLTSVVELDAAVILVFEGSTPDRLTTLTCAWSSSSSSSSVIIISNHHLYHISSHIVSLICNQQRLFITECLSTCWVPHLDHEALHHSVYDRAVVITLQHELYEVPK